MKTIRDNVMSINVLLSAVVATVFSVSATLWFSISQPEKLQCIGALFSEDIGCIVVVSVYSRSTTHGFEPFFDPLDSIELVRPSGHFYEMPDTPATTLPAGSTSGIVTDTMAID